MFEILTSLAQISPIIAIMVAALFYFLKKEKAYQSEIKELNTVIRDNEKENLTLINKLADALDHLADSKKDIKEEIAILKEFISLKLEQLKR